MSELISWKEIKGNPYFEPLTLKMLTREGEIKTKMASTKFSKDGSDREVRDVVYDREFVIQKIINTLGVLWFYPEIDKLLEECKHQAINAKGE